MNHIDFLKLIEFKPIRKIYDSYDMIHIFEFHLRNSEKHVANIEFSEKQNENDKSYVYLEILDLTNYIDETIISNDNFRKVHYLKLVKTGSDDEYNEIADEINNVMKKYEKS